MSFLCFLEGMFYVFIVFIYMGYDLYTIYTGLFAEETGFRGDVAFRRHL